MKKFLNAVLCLCLLSLLGSSPGRAQQEAPQAPPAQPAAAPEPAETPAAQSRTSIIQAPPPIPKYPDVQMPGETGYYAGILAWLPYGTPILDKGHGAAFTGATYFHLPGTSKVTPGVEVGLALGMHNSLDFSYFSAKDSGNVAAPGPLVVFGEAYNKGDQLATSNSLQDFKLSFAYLTWPYPVEHRHFRLRTLYQVHYLHLTSNYDAPVRSATPDSSGNFTSYATTGSRSFVLPALGLGVTEYALRNLRIELHISGFDIPHHNAIGDGDALAAYRIGSIEIRVGGHGLYYKSTTQSDYYFRGKAVGAFVGVRWCSD